MKGTNNCLESLISHKLSTAEMQKIVGGCLRIVINGVCIYDGYLPKGRRWYWQQ